MFNTYDEYSKPNISEEFFFQQEEIFTYNIEWKKQNRNLYLQ